MQTLAAVTALVLALAFGPVRLTVRAALRAVFGRGAMRRWQGPATLGAAAGILAAPVAAAALFDGAAAIRAAVVALVLLLAVLDLAWRWLPHEWTVPLLVLGLLAGFLGATGGDALAGAATGAGLLAALRIGFRLARGVEAIGFGDVWLAAGLGTFAGPATILWVLALAAITALVSEAVAERAAAGPKRRRFGVAYGTHICGVFLILFYS